jgi:hypothetical protein
VNHIFAGQVIDGIGTCRPRLTKVVKKLVIVQLLVSLWKVNKNEVITFLRHGGYQYHD